MRFPHQGPQGFGRTQAAHPLDRECHIVPSYGSGPRDTHNVSRRQAKRYTVRGRVQGVGFRWFVTNSAGPIGVTGWVRNLDDGAVEVYAIGTQEQLAELESSLWRGPHYSEVRGVNGRDDVIDADVRGFRIR